MKFIKLLFFTLVLMCGLVDSAYCSEKQLATKKTKFVVSDYQLDNDTLNNWYRIYIKDTFEFRENRNRDKTGKVLQRIYEMHRRAFENYSLFFNINCTASDFYNFAKRDYLIQMTRKTMMYGIPESMRHRISESITYLDNIIKCLIKEKGDNLSRTEEELIWMKIFEQSLEFLIKKGYKSRLDFSDEILPASKAQIQSNL